MKISYTLFGASFIALLTLIQVMPDANLKVAGLERLETAIVPAGSFLYRASGEYLRDGFPVDAPLEEIVFDTPIEIMKYQVGVGDYETCVEEGGCALRDGQGRHNAELPVTGVSYRDAVSYATWLSNKSNFNWRLPTDKEWSYVAGSRFVDDALKIEIGRENIAKRWLKRYRKYANTNLTSAAKITERGSFGVNENGIYDMSGNIWEWTNGCYKRTRLDVSGTEISTTNNCGVRISAGQHRAYISSFIQDARGGGCSVGVPPKYLGFRLIKEVKGNMFSFIFDLFG